MSATEAPPSDTDTTVDPIHEECVARLRALGRENGSWRIKCKRLTEANARLVGVEESFVRLTDALARQRVVQP